MKREIKFRALHEGEWIYSNEGDGLYDFFYGISDGQTNGDTLCQFTGLKDKNGREIYEGDIVRETFKEITKRGSKQIINKPKVVDFFSGSFIFRKAEIGKCGPEFVRPFTSKGILEFWEVIGNIYES